MGLWTQEEVMIDSVMEIMNWMWCHPAEWLLYG